MFGVVGGVSTFYWVGGFWDARYFYYNRALYFLLAESVFDSFVMFIIGVMVWRILITSVQIRKLVKEFDLTPQPRHPDRVGGFAPLGELCLWNALPLTILLVLLGGWIILIQYPPYNIYYTSWAPFYWPWLVLVAVTMIIFSWPLWSVHQAMVTKREDVQHQLAYLAQNISRQARELLDRADELEPEESEKLAKQLEVMRTDALMQQIYQQNIRYPVWPVNLGILAKFSAIEFVPLLLSIVL